MSQECLTEIAATYADRITARDPEATYPLLHPNGKWYAVPARMRGDLHVASEAAWETRTIWKRTGNRAPFAEAQAFQHEMFEAIERTCPVLTDRPASTPLPGWEP